MLYVQGLQHRLHETSSPNTANQRRCSSTQSFLINQSATHTNNIHSSIRRHRLRPSVINSPLCLQHQHLPEQQTSFNDHVLITEFGAI